MFDEAEAQRALEDNFAPWVLALRPRVVAVGTGRAELRIPITPELARVGGIVSGQALAALADTSMVIATAAHFGALRPVATTNLDTQFLRPGSGDSVLCRAEVVRAGKALVFARAVLIAEPAGKDIATATATFFVP
ncbi:PaaI family thioesterase [Rhodosalinus sp.]|uniref:PaaI family thioesterase n=1 Tax=Rhodosalinus sp. TaxID=2047741 RepID=UPI00397A07CB